VVGQFYGEFLKYTAGDKKGIGYRVDTTARAELFSLLPMLATRQGSGYLRGYCGFLISAMQHMLKKAVTEEERTDIKQNRLIGIEEQSEDVCLGRQHMILRGDGKANLHQSSCFDDAVIKSVKAMKPNVGMLNPPYAQSKSDAELHDCIL